MGSTPLLSSSSSLPESDDGGGDDAVANGSLRYVDDGTALANSPRLFLRESWEDGRRRRVGRSEALRMVGLAFSGSAILLGRWGTDGMSDTRVSERGRHCYG